MNMSVNCCYRAMVNAVGKRSITHPTPVTFDC